MNLTIVVDDDILKRAPIRAIQENTSVNAVVREYLTAYAGADRHRAKAQGKLVHALDLSASCSGCGVSEHVGWDREDLWMGRAC